MSKHNAASQHNENPPPAPQAVPPSVQVKPLDQWTIDEVAAKLADKTIDNMERHAYASRLSVLCLSAIQAEAKEVNAEFTKLFTDALIGTRYTVDRLVANKAGAVKLGPVGVTREGKEVFITVQT